MKIYTATLGNGGQINEFEAEESTAVPGMMVVRIDPICTSYFNREGKGWFRTRAEAIAAIERKRAAKISSLRKQIKRLEEMPLL